MRTIPNRLIPTAVALLMPAASIPHLPAQDQAAAKTSAAPTFRLVTNDPMVAQGIARSASVGDLPESPSVAFVLDDGGAMQATAIDDPGVMLGLDCSPRTLAALFAPALDQVRLQAIAMSSLAGSQAGLAPKDASLLVESVLSMPEQITRLKLRVERLEDTQFDAALELVPAEGSWLGALVSNLKPNEAGVHPSPLAKPLFATAFDLDLAAVRKQLAPIYDFTFRIGAMRPDTREAAEAYGKQFADSLDGTMSMAYVPGTGFVSLSGTRDAAAATKLLTDADYAEHEAEKSEATGSEVEIDTKAGTHRDAPLVRVDMRMPETPMPNPIAPDGTMTGWRTVAKDTIISTWGPKGETTALIDRILDGKLSRKPLPGKALMTLSLRVNDLLDWFDQAMQGMAQLPPADEVPETVEAALTRNGNTLRLGVKVR